MAFFDKLGDTLVSVGKDVSQKAKDVSGITKLNMDIRSKENAVKNLYAQIGQAYYEAHQGEDVKEKDIFEQIRTMKEDIARMELQILELKKAKKCPKCGAEVSEEAEFCSSCGERLGVVAADSEYKEAAQEETETTCNQAEDSAFLEEP